MDTVQITESDELAAGVCQLVDDPSLDQFVTRVLVLFPVGTPALARPLVEALRRIATVPWLGNTLGYDPTDPLDRLLPLLAAQQGFVARPDACRLLAGSWDLAATMVGTEAEPMRGAESLRAALWVCRERWVRSGHHLTATTALASRIRGAVQQRDRRSVEQHPIARLFPSISKAKTLPEFLAATRPLLGSPSKAVQDVWTVVDQELRRKGGASRPVLTPPGGTRGGNDADDDDELRYEAFIEHIHKVPIQRPDAPSMSIEGEPAAEVAVSEIIAPLDGPTRNEDQRRDTYYRARQVVWSQNNLLLTCHPDVLVLDLYKDVLAALVAGINEVEDLDLRIGMASLLLQGITGRTTRRIGGLHVTERLEATPRAPLELSLSEGVLRIRVFFARYKNEPNGYYTPTPEEATYLEPASSAFVIPLNESIMAVLCSQGIVRTLGQQTVERLESVTRQAARWVGQQVGLPVTVGQVRRSFSAHLYEQCRDLVVTQLICADTLGLSDAPAHYYAPRMHILADAYIALSDKLGFGGVREEFVPSDDRTGSHLLVRRNAVREMVASVALPRRQHGGAISQADAIEVHQAMVRYLACMLVATTGHRPVNELFKLALDNIDLEGAWALFRDKLHDPAHDPRPVALPTCVVDQLAAYLSHLLVLGEVMPALQRRIRLVLTGKAKLLFGLSPEGMPLHLNWSKFAMQLPPEWHRVPRNWGRTWLRTYAVEQGLPPELALIQLGHLEACGYPFSGASPTEFPEFVATIRAYLDKVMSLQGWKVATGLGRVKRVAVELLPLQSWQSSIRNHGTRAGADAKSQRVADRAKLRSYRDDAKKYVLEYPELVEAGIPALYIDKSGPWRRHRITKAVAESIRDRMVEDAYDDAAMGRARASALRGVLHQVNKRVGMQGEDPAELASFRHLLDNAYLSGMVLAVRQVRAMRQHALDSGKRPPGDWRDFALACARTANAMALFGFCDDPDQIEGALRHREQLVRPAVIKDLVLVPWGDVPHQVLGLRGLAALAIAKLAKKYPAAEVPPRAAINQSLANLFPDWAKADGEPGKDPSDVDWLQLLCETISVTNRYELSSGSRLALAREQGSVPAHIQEQAMLLDGDAAGSTKRKWEHAVEETTSQPRQEPSGPRRGNARTQYLALCATIPSSGQDISLPLIGVSITADELEWNDAREKVIAEIEAQLALATADKALQPIVRALTTWVLDMLKNGTPLRENPANSTVETYLTRIGGALVERFGNGSLGDVGDAELEDAYLAVVECNDKKRVAAARAILQFHSCCVREYGFPELDLTEVRAYLRQDQRNVDAALILPTERVAAVDWLRARAEAPTSSSGGGGRQRVRVERQALAAYPFYSQAGARRSEVLGLRFKDIYIGAGGESVIRIRNNRSRRIKTRAARRLIWIPASTPREEIDWFRTWVEADRHRLLRWRGETKYVFSPLCSGRAATGRSEIAEAVMQALRSATGRSHERIHRLRHLVAFERTTPVFLSPVDRNALANIVASIPEFGSGVALPRDFAAQTIPLGHAWPKTTLRCYHHFPWLLRSRADARIAAEYVNRRGAAAVMGLTLVAADKVTQQYAAGTPKGTAWLDHVSTRRVAPEVASAIVPLGTVPVERSWSSVEVGELVKLVERGKSLDDALKIVGADMAEASRIREAFGIFERRLGRRVLGDKWVLGTGAQRRVIRNISQAEPLEVWWQWADDTSDQARRAGIEVIAAHVWELMMPRDGDRIRVSSGDVIALVRLLAAAGIDERHVQHHQDGMGFELMRVLRPGVRQPGATQSGKQPVARYMGWAVKRSVGVVWVAIRLRGR